MERKNRKSASSPAGETTHHVCLCSEGFSIEVFNSGCGEPQPTAGGNYGTRVEKTGVIQQPQGAAAVILQAGSYTRADPAPTRVNVVFHH